MTQATLLLALISTAILSSACGDDGMGTDADPDGATDSATDSAPQDGEMPDGSTDERPSYWFESRFNAGENSVNHAGQSTRQVLLADLVAEMTRLAVGVREGTIEPTSVDEEGEVTARLNAFYRSGSLDLGTRPIPNLLAEGDTLCQATYEDLGDANLFSKTAGQDAVTDHADWSTAFAGWSDSSHLGGADVSNPVALVDAIFATFEAQVRACALSVDDCVETPAGDPLPLYVTPEGLDLVQLVQKHLLGAVHFSQGTDDYLDDDVEDKGLRSDNTMPEDDGAPDTTLEHAWDEAYGYFGAAADYDEYTDDEIRAAGGRPEYASGYHDFDANSCIDVFSEYNFAASVNAAKRDAGSMTGVDLTADAFVMFASGRRLITEAGGALSTDQMAELADVRDDLVTAWEKALSATVVHYINEVNADMAACGSAEYSFVDHAKHWSELKGFALAFQYNPRSPFVAADADFEALHTSIGDRPVLCDGDTGAYETALQQVRDTLQNAYGFEATDVESW